MKVKIFIAVAVMLCAGAVSAQAEEAQPGTIPVTVNGKTSEADVYNIYGNNYLMLRDMAGLLKDTDKQFNVNWKYNRIYIHSGEAYDGTDTDSREMMKPCEALFKTEMVVLNNKDGSLSGYNIYDHNYYRIRDIARIFDFSVEYENGGVIIDTSKSYIPQRQLMKDGVNGLAYEADLALFVDEMPLQAYYASVDAAYNNVQAERLNEHMKLNNVFINAVELKNYGFDVDLSDDEIKLTRNKEKRFELLDSDIINSAPDDIAEICGSDKKVYLDGNEVMNIEINGEPYISVAELAVYGEVTDDIRAEGGFCCAYDDGVYIDFFKSGLKQNYDMTDEEVLQNETLISSTEYKPDAEIGRYSLSTSEKSIKYIGGMDSEYRFNGYGVYEECWLYGRAGAAPTRYYVIKCGEFRDNELYCGVKYTQDSDNHNPELENEKGIRSEGDIKDGFRRDAVAVSGNWENYEYFEKYKDVFRFGYRIDCEGSVKDGEYCGYYKKYGEDGSLIFEGDYKEYVKLYCN
ncbi:MAG: hypothetical protein Q4G33_03285 [bacterium]|nr:hypothetical protein [bacterium]